MSDMRLASMRLASAGDKVEVLVVTKENKKMVVKQLRAWNKSINQGISRERLEKLLFVSPVPINLPKPAKVHIWSDHCHNLSKVLLESPSWLNTSLPLTPAAAFDFHIHVLLHLTMQVNGNMMRLHNYWQLFAFARKVIMSHSGSASDNIP